LVKVDITEEEVQEEGSGETVESEERKKNMEKVGKCSWKEDE